MQDQKKLAISTKFIPLSTNIPILLHHFTTIWKKYIHLFSTLGMNWYVRQLEYPTQTSHHTTNKEYSEVTMQDVLTDNYMQETGRLHNDNAWLESSIYMYYLGSSYTCQYNCPIHDWTLRLNILIYRRLASHPGGAHVTQVKYENKRGSQMEEGRKPESYGVRYWAKALGQ